MACGDLIPEHCRLIEQGTISALLKNEHASSLLKLGVLNPRELLKHSGHALPKRQFKGRGLLASLPLDDGAGTRVVVKPCLRGGLIRYVSSDIFCGGNRPFEEMRSNLAIVARGIPTAEIIAAVKEKLLGPFYRAYLFSLELPDSIDLTSYFNHLKGLSGEQRFRAKSGIFEAVAHAFTAMHRSGIYHRDLHLKNVLLRRRKPPADPEIFIIDFDRAVLKTRLHPAEKLNNLMRFNRSIEKYRMVSRSITRVDQMKLCRTYLAENEDAARLLPRALRWYRLSIGLRQLKWKLHLRRMQ